MSEKGHTTWNSLSDTNCQLILNSASDSTSSLTNKLLACSQGCRRGTFAHQCDKSRQWQVGIHLSDSGDITTTNTSATSDLVDSVCTEFDIKPDVLYMHIAACHQAKLPRVNTSIGHFLRVPHYLQEMSIT